MFAGRPLHGQQAAPKRPKITGISHVAYLVSDLPKAIAFWHDFLGLDEAYSLKKKDSDEVRIAFIKINDRQHIELFNEPPPHPPNMMSHPCFTVDDIEAMRTYLRTKGFEVPPENGKTRAGDYGFEIKDPDGTLVEFVQTSGGRYGGEGRWQVSTRHSRLEADLPRRLPGREQRKGDGFLRKGSGLSGDLEARARS